MDVGKGITVEDVLNKMPSTEYPTSSNDITIIDIAKIKSTHFCDGGAQNLLKQELYIKLTYIAHLFTITNFLMVMSVFFIFCDQNAEFDVTQSLILSELGMYIAELTSTVAMHVFSCSDIIHLQ